jgi:hypothetical protein
VLEALLQAGKALPNQVTIYYKKIMIVNDTSRVIRMMPQLRVSLMNIILSTIEVSFMLPESSFLLPESSILLLKSTYSTDITHYQHHLLQSSYFNTGNTKGGKYHCTIDLLFGLACFANKNKNCQLS